MSTLDHNFNEIAARAEKHETNASKCPPPFSIRLTFDDRARLDAERGRVSLAAHNTQSDQPAFASRRSMNDSKAGWRPQVPQITARKTVQFRTR